MRHDWIFDVLTDLRKYAEKNDLAAIAAEAARMLDVVRKELSEKTRAEQGLVDDARAAQLQTQPQSGDKNSK